MIGNNRLLTATEVAELLGVSVRQLRNLRKSGVLSPVQIGVRSVRWREGDVMAYINSLPAADQQPVEVKSEHQTDIVDFLSDEEGDR